MEHEPWPVEASKYPWAQSWQAVPNRENLPAAQSVQSLKAVLPEPESLPAAQSSHEVEPVFAWYLPVEQSVHV